MSKYVIGLDGGGTGSKGIVADLSGQILAEMKGGPINYVGADKKLIDENITSLIKKGLDGRSVKDCAAICIGTAGISREDVRSNLEAIIKKLGFTCPYTITTDSHTAHAGALSGRDGIVVIAGTGAICLGIKDKESIRVGGYGHIVDDEGSAYYIGRLILRAVVRAEDGRDPKTLLRDLVFEKLGIKQLPELISWIYSPERIKKDIASLATLVEEAAMKGDKTAFEIEEKAGKELAILCEPAIKFMGNNCTIAVSGSVLQRNERIRDYFKEEVEARHPWGFGTDAGICVIDAQYEADYGAMLLALDLASQA